MKDDIKIRGMIITLQDRQRIIKVGDDAFTVQIPLPGDRVNLSTQIANAIGGRDLKSIPTYEYQFTKMIVTLNFVLVKTPDWWDGAENCMDEDLLATLYKEYDEFEADFQKSLKKNKFAKPNGKV